MPSDITGTDILEEDRATGTRELPLRQGPDLRQHHPRRRDQPHAAQDPGRAAPGDAGAPGHRRRAAPTRWTCPSSSSPPRTPSSRRAPTRCPRPSSTASCSWSTWATPPPRRRCRSSRAPPAADSRRADEGALARADPRAAGAGAPRAGAGPRGALRGGAGAPDAARRSPAPPSSSRKHVDLGRRPARAPVPGPRRPRRARCSTGRFAATVEDVRALARPVLRHRVLPNFHAEAEGITSRSIVEQLLEMVKG